MARSRESDNERNEQRQREVQAQRQADTERQVQAQRQVDAQRRVDGQRQRQYDGQRRADVQRRNDWSRDNDWNRNNNSRVYVRPSYRSRGYNRTVIVPRIIRPSIVTVVPYRPYVYRPRFSLGVYYGSGGAYPYGYIPQGYYDPLPGRIYGGVRITGAPREAQVFADGYYVGIVNDFDGTFQHMNLEAGPHHIEIDVAGYDEPIGFDVVVQPGRTITFRADGY